MIALLVALAVAALISVQPWDKSTLAPHVSLAPPGLEGAVGDAVEVAPGQPFAVAPAQSLGGGVASPATSAFAVTSEPAPMRRGISVARVVVSGGQGSAPGGPPEPAAEPAAPQPAPAPEAVPVAAPVSAPAPDLAPPARVPAGSGSPPPGPIAGGVDPGEEVPSPTDSVEIQAGEKLEYSFSFYVEPTAFRLPGEDMPIVQIRGEESESARFGLQLWDDGAGQRGLWANGEAAGGERFLTPLAEGVAHEATLYLLASSEDDGFYVLTVDGQPVDARAWISLIDSGSDHALIETFVP